MDKTTLQRNFRQTVSYPEERPPISAISGIRSKGSFFAILPMNRSDLSALPVPSTLFCFFPVYDIINLAKQKDENPFILILDGIEDPHNLGSIIRTAETAGVHGVIIPKRRAASVNSTVNKVSAGAVEHMKIARVNNINETINTLKKEGIWICGTDMDTNKYYYNQDLTGPLAIVIGSEGYGMSRLVKENCDFLVKIPMQGQITSLNASVSAGIVIYEAVKQRIKN